MALARYTLRQFEAFVAVADLLGFHAAGKRLGLSASAVSQLVAELEALLGFKLFERTTRRVRLSSPGRDFIPTAEALLLQLRHVEAEAKVIRSRASGTVRIGAPQMLASTLLPEAIGEYLQHHPRITIRIVDTPVGMLPDRVRSGEVDIAVGPASRHDKNIEQEVLLNNPWVLWCAPDSLLAAQTRITWAQLRDTALVIAWPDPLLDTVRLPSAAGRPGRSGQLAGSVRPVEVVDNISTALGLAKTGHLAAMAPAIAHVVEMADHMGLVRKSITEPDLACPTCLYRPQSIALSPASEAFAAFLGRWLRNRAASKQAQHASSEAH